MLDIGTYDGNVLFKAIGNGGRSGFGVGVDIDRDGFEQKNEKAAGLTILDKLENEGLVALDVLNTRQLRGKLWEIKFYDDNRIMYIVADMDNIYLIHACKKQKGKR